MTMRFLVAFFIAAASSAAQAESIVAFGADVTGASDSTVAIQAAIDNAASLPHGRQVLCPEGAYKVAPLLFIDPPGNLRGADGFHGQSYSGGQGYGRNYTVNSGGIAYISLQNSNTGHDPASSPAWWRPFLYSSVLSYQQGDIVSYSPLAGLPPVPWVALQAASAQSPALGSTYWRPTQIPPTIFSGSAVFVGSEGGGVYASFARGCVLNFTSNNNTAIWIGPQWGNVVKNVTINGCGFGNCRHTGLQPSNGVGIGIAGGSSGANSTTIDHVGISNFYTLIRAEYNNGETGFAAENTFNKLWGSNCYYGIVVNGGDSFINSVSDPAVACTNAFVSAADNLDIQGGNWSQNTQVSNSFSITNISALSATVDPGTALYSYSFSGQILAPDTNISACGPNIGNCVYNSWIILDPHFGLIPMVMTAWDGATNTGTFQTIVSWGTNFGQNQNALSATGLQASVQSANVIYAAERATFVSGGNIVTATNGWIENNGNCATVAVSPGAVSFRGVRWNGDPGLSAYSGAMFYCQQSFPLFDLQPGGRIRIDDSFPQQSLLGSSIIIDLLGSGFISGGNNNNGYTSSAFFRPAVRALGEKTGGPSYWAANPFYPYPPQGQKFGEPYVGWLPASWATPRIDAATFGLWKNIAGQTIGNYHVAVGNTIYNVFDPIAVGGRNLLVQSQHQFASYGQNLTPSNVPGLSLSWQGQTFVVLADANTLAVIYPGLGVNLDNGSGDVRYVVSGIFPKVSLDGGVHPGYFTVVNATASGWPYLLTGSVGATYTAAKIDQAPYVWFAVGGGPVQ